MTNTLGMKSHVDFKLEDFLFWPRVIALSGWFTAFMVNRIKAFY